MTTNTLRATDQIAELKTGAERAPSRRERTSLAADGEPRAGAFASKLRGKLKRGASGMDGAEKSVKQADAKQVASKPTPAGERESAARADGTRSDRSERDAGVDGVPDAVSAQEADATDAPGAGDGGVEPTTDEGSRGAGAAVRSDAAPQTAEREAREGARAKTGDADVSTGERAVREAGGTAAGEVPVGAPITIAVVNRQLVQADPRLLARGSAGVRIARASAGDEAKRARGPASAREDAAAAAQGDAPETEVVGARQFGRVLGQVEPGVVGAPGGAGAGGSAETESRRVAAGPVAGREPPESRAAAGGAGGRIDTPDARLVPEAVGPLGGAGLRAEAPGEDAAGKVLPGAVEGVGRAGRAAPGLRLRAEVQAGGREGKSGQGPPDFTAVEAQVSRGMAAVLAQRGGTVALRLQPAALGELRVQLDWERGSVSVRFVAASEKARGLLEETLPGLRASLEARGLEVVRVAVESPGAPKADAGMGAAPQPEQGLGAQGHAGGGHGGAGEDRPGNEQSGPARSAGRAVNAEFDALGPEAGAASTDGGPWPAAVWAEPGDGVRLARLRVDAWA